MKLFNFSMILMLMVASMPVLGAGDAHFYQVSLLRAAPGQLPDLIDWARQSKGGNGDDMLIMRHSQGDHWDLMLLMPTSSALPTPFSYQAKADFQQDFLVSSGTSWSTIKQLSGNADLFHIEMFHAASGAYDKLLEQRKMENNYLAATGRNKNLIFETEFGSDVDLFTLGIYPNLQAFAAEPDLAAEVFEKAAVAAGFKARADIGFYLRQFIVAHQDTLATQVE